MKLELKSIGYWSLIKISFVVNLVGGFIIGFFFALFVGFFLSLADKLGTMGGMPIPMDEIPSIGLLIIIYPFLFGFFGAVFNTILYVIIAFIYNVGAKVLGGVELEFGEVAQVAPAPAPTYQPTPEPYYQRSTPPPPPPVQPWPSEAPPTAEPRREDQTPPPAAGQ